MYCYNNPIVKTCHNNYNCYKTYYDHNFPANFQVPYPPDFSAPEQFPLRICPQPCRGPAPMINLQGRAT